LKIKIPIDHTKLIDSPFDGENQSLFQFTTNETDNFIQDVINGNPTCYLVSGYRGAGKSSFIKKLETEITKQDNTTLFIYLNFAKYEDRSIVLRKLIRNFYLAAEDKDIFNKLTKENSKELLAFRELYERTFYEVSKNTNEKTEDKTTSTFNFKASLKDIIIILSSLLISVSIIFGLQATNWYSWILSLIPLAGVFKYFSYEIKSTSEKSNSSATSKSLLYDDEIAEYRLIELLTSFHGKLKPVFVLDELDKIKDDELAENLINELKPIMLSGLASFIVVAGQNLFYNYYSSQTQDDGILSSLFSKIHHISLFPASELRILFSKLINEDSFTKDEKLLRDAYVDYLVFESKRIPRRFIILIRQNIVWDDNKAYLEINKTLDELSIYSKILNRVENIEDQAISSEDYHPAIHDYFSMQLLLKAHEILSSQDLFFTDFQIFNSNG
jgi:AAA ATPase-like protein